MPQNCHCRRHTGSHWHAATATTTAALLPSCRHSCRAANTALAPPPTRYRRIGAAANALHRCTAHHRRTADALRLPPTPRCCQAAAASAITYVLIVVLVAISIAVATAAFKWLLIVVYAPAITVTAGVFIATVVARGGSAAPATLLLPLMLQCHQTAAANANPAAAGMLPPLPLPPHAVSFLLNLEAAQWGRGVLFSDEQKLLFEGDKKGFVKNTKFGFYEILTKPRMKAT
jgi:hypothetical protein